MVDERTKIDWTKPIEVMNGTEAKYYETVRQSDGLPECGHVVRVGLLLRWLDDFGRDTHGSVLVRNKPPEKRRVTMWANCYESGLVTLHFTREEAFRETLGGYRQACIPVVIEWTPGEFPEESEVT